MIKIISKHSSDWIESVDKLVMSAKNAGFESVILADNNLNWIFQFKEACEKYNINPIIWVNLPIAGSFLPNTLIVAKNDEGLMELIDLYNTFDYWKDYFDEEFFSKFKNIYFIIDTLNLKKITKATYTVYQNKINPMGLSRFFNVFDKQIILNENDSDRLKEKAFQKPSIYKTIKNLHTSRLFKSEYSKQELKDKLIAFTFNSDSSSDSDLTSLKDKANSYLEEQELNTTKLTDEEKNSFIELKQNLTPYTFSFLDWTFNFNKVQSTDNIFINSLQISDDEQLKLLTNNILNNFFNSNKFKDLSLESVKSILEDELNCIKETKLSWTFLSLHKLSLIFKSKNFVIKVRWVKQSLLIMYLFWFTWINPLTTWLYDKRVVMKSLKSKGDLDFEIPLISNEELTEILQNIYWNDFIFHGFYTHFHEQGLKRNLKDLFKQSFEDSLTEKEKEILKLIDWKRIDKTSLISSKDTLETLYKNRWELDLYNSIMRLRNERKTCVKPVSLFYKILIWNDIKKKVPWSVYKNKKNNNLFVLEAEDINKQDFIAIHLLKTRDLTTSTKRNIDWTILMELDFSEPSNFDKVKENLNKLTELDFENIILFKPVLVKTDKWLKMIENIKTFNDLVNFFFFKHSLFTTNWKSLELIFDKDLKLKIEENKTNNDIYNEITKETYYQIFYTNQIYDIFNKVFWLSDEKIYSLVDTIKENHKLQESYESKVSFNKGFLKWTLKDKINKENEFLIDKIAIAFPYSFIKEFCYWMAETIALQLYLK